MDYFSQVLRYHITAYFPQLHGQAEWLSMRCAQAETVYERERKAGKNVDQAIEEAQKTLLDGLEFSLYELIHTLLSEEFTEEIPSTRIGEISLRLLPACESLLTELPITIADLQEESPLYWAFKLEVIGVMSEWLETNGI